MKEKKYLIDNKELMKEWDWDKNINLDPKELTIGSSKKAWWKCSKCGNYWEARIYNRATLGSRCIYCTNQKAISGINDLQTLYPNLLEEWDYEKNLDMDPKNYKPGSNVSVWWKCKLGHSWKCSINHRTNGTNCPKCFGENGTSFAEQAILYYLSKNYSVQNRIKINDQEIDIYLPDCNVGFEYDGKFYHSSEKSKIKENQKDERLNSLGIKIFHIKEADDFKIIDNIIYCKPDRDYVYLNKTINMICEILNLESIDVNINRDRSSIYSQYVLSIKNHSLLNENPNLAQEWDYENNEGLLPENFRINSNAKVYWKCPNCNSSYAATISHRNEGTGCPFCDGKLVNESNNLKNKYPKLAETWDYNKNLTITPETIYFSSRKKVWWICPECSKSFEAPVCSRIRSKVYDCPECMHKRIGKANMQKSVSKDKRLLILRPDIAQEWNYEKNIDIKPDEVSCGSGKKVWWKCSKCGYEWITDIYNRTHGTGCPNYKRHKVEGGKNEK